MIFDLKMDLGYKRNEFTNQVQERINQLLEIKKFKGKCSLSQQDDISFSSKLKWNYIVISKENINEKQYNDIEFYFKRLKNKAKLFTLLTDGHLNSYDKNFIPNINDKEFNRLNKEIIKL